jgi:uncharacterized protein YqjF (DUF2071 family)
MAATAGVPATHRHASGPVPVGQPVMFQRWALVTHLHWPYDPTVM